MEQVQRALVHAALGDPTRLRMVDLLASRDLTVKELGDTIGMAGNLLAHHLDVLDDAGVIERRTSEGDRRRRYVALHQQTLDRLLRHSTPLPETVLFVCSHNSARSQYAAAYWRATTGQYAPSAGSQPAAEVHPKAIQVAAERGLDLSTSMPKGYESVTTVPDLVVSVCDRAREGDLPKARDHWHWSIPDPVPTGRLLAFRSAFSEIERRIDHLTS